MARLKSKNRIQNKPAQKDSSWVGIFSKQPSKKTLILIALIFGALGSYIVYRSFAAVTIPPTSSFTIAAVGDINPSGNKSVTSNSGKNAAAITAGLNNGTLDAFIGLGDYQYTNTTCSTDPAKNTVGAFDSLWKGVVSKTYPTFGPNHDWDAVSSYNPAIPGTQQYWNGECPGMPNKSALNTLKGTAISPIEFYSYDIGNWHFASLPSGLWRLNSTRANQITVELEADLKKAKSEGKNLAAVYHDPYFTTTTDSHGPETAVKPWIDAMERVKATAPVGVGVRFTLSGSQHNYERTCPLINTGACTPDTGNGTTVFNASTGGTGLRKPKVGATIPNYLNPAHNPSTKSFYDTYGWLEMTLNPDGSFSWLFHSVSGPGADSGSRPKLGGGPVTPPPVTPPTPPPTPPTPPSTPPDTTPPTTTITSQPPASTANTTADLSFTSNEAGTFLCKLDTAAFAACTSPKNYIGLSVGTHTFSVQAKDNAGNVDLSPATYTWSVGETTPPPVPDQTAPSISITTPTPDSTVSGTITAVATATDNVGVVGVQFKLDGANVGTEDTSAPYQYSRNTLSPVLSNGTHTITAVARDAAGNSTTAAAVNFTVNNGDTTAPTAPASLRTTATPTTTSVSLAWNAATDNTSVARYNVLRGGAVIAMLDSPTLTFIDTSLSASTSYSYVVQAVDAAGNTSPSSNTLSVTTAAPPQTSDTTKPTVPALTLAVVSSTQINLSWTASTDGSGIRGYNLYRYTQDPGANPNAAAIKLNSTLLPNSSLSFGSTSLSPSTTYFYRVEAVDNSTNLNTSQTAAQSATTQAAPATPPPTRPGDMTGPSGSSDGVISIEDISYVIRAIQAYNTNPTSVDPKADVSGPNGVPDGKISIEDISYVIRNYGK